MKSKLLAIALLAVIVGFGACSGKKNDPKSDKCDITSFKDGNTVWEINQSARTIIGQYKKQTPLDNIVPTIVCSPGAKVSPASGVVQKFDGKTVKYTVTAEDGKTTKEYTASATAELP